MISLLVEKSACIIPLEKSLWKGVASISSDVLNAFRQSSHAADSTICIEFMLLLTASSMDKLYQNALIWGSLGRIRMYIHTAHESSLA